MVHMLTPALSHRSGGLLQAGCGGPQPAVPRGGPLLPAPLPLHGFGPLLPLPCASLLPLLPLLFFSLLALLASVLSRPLLRLPSSAHLLDAHDAHAVFRRQSGQSSAAALARTPGRLTIPRGFVRSSDSYFEIQLQRKDKALAVGAVSRPKRRVVSRRRRADGSAHRRTPKQPPHGGTKTVVLRAR